MSKSEVLEKNTSVLKSVFGSNVVKRSDVYEEAEKLGMTAREGKNVVYKSMVPAGKRGYYKFPSSENTAPPEPVMNLQTPPISMRSVASVVDDEIYVPEKLPEYIKWGEFNTIEKIIKSEMFFPVYISGPSGNGKTMMVEQACAKANREYVRAQISPETDEDDLIGGFRLINGETVFQKGPVIKAMERGCILLIDEIDRATNKIMCLQGILEGNPVLLKKTGEVIKPAPGFNIIATANTKGRGSSDGRYTAATVIDDAFLERFVASIDQPFPQPTVERKIVKAHMMKYDKLDENFLNKLIAWSKVIRKTFEADGVDDVISTRRLCHITKTYAIFDDRMKSIELCISRFDEETRDAFIDLYSKIDEDADSALSTVDSALNFDTNEDLEHTMNAIQD